MDKWTALRPAHLSTDTTTMKTTERFYTLDWTRTVLTTALGGRFHELHTGGQGLKCATCHTQKAEGYNDPMAQVSKPVDKNACLGCHSSNRVFYGDEWQRSATGK